MSSEAKSQRQTVLVVDDDAAIRNWMERLVRPLDVELVAAGDGKSALAAVLKSEIDVVLLDMNLPDMSGIEVCRQMRAMPALKDLPIIFLTAADDSEAKVRAFECGASDYVTKPFDVRELRARVRNALWTESLRAQLHAQANTDALTGLPNRKAFRSAVERQIARAAADPNYGFSLMFVDLDRFKIVNDSLGHEVGDRLLVHVGASLTQVSHGAVPAGQEIPERDWLVARLGGDEFTLLLPGMVDETAVRDVAARVIATLATPAILGGFTLRAGGSVGIRMCRGEGNTPLLLNDLLRDADVAMYQAKASGRGRFALFDHAMHQQVLDRLSMENDLQSAIARGGGGELQLVYQPLIDLRTGAVEAFEALLRWNHPRLGPVPPSTFVALAEESELILDLGNWVTRTAAEFASSLVQCHDTFARVSVPRVCVNISKRQLSNPTFFQDIMKVLDATRLPPEQLELEITESTIMYDPRMIVPVLSALRERGVRLAIDDFGTGYSSLSTLPQFPVNTLKIDRSFIHEIGISRGETAIVNAVVSLALHLGMSVVAEGIETCEQLCQLQSIGCDLGQGYLLGRPASADVARSMPARLPVEMTRALLKGAA